MKFCFSSGVEPLNGGLFKSSGTGRHPKRVIDSNEIIFVVEGVLEIFSKNV